MVAVGRDGIAGNCTEGAIASVSLPQRLSLFRLGTWGVHQRGIIWHPGQLENANSAFHDWGGGVMPSPGGVSASGLWKGWLGIAQPQLLQRC